MKNIHILATGGTISAAGSGGKTSGYYDGKFRIEELVEGVRGIGELAHLEGE